MQILDGILLFILSFVFVRFKPEVTTVAEWVIPVIIFLDFVYFLLSWKGKEVIGSEKQWKIKYVLIALIFLLLIGKSFVAAVRMRYLYPRTYPVHDSIIQIEQAAKFLTQGQNPYGKNYQGIGMERDWKDNPGVFHLIYLPFYLIFSTFFLNLFNTFFGCYDERLVHLLALMIILVFLWKRKNNHVLSSSLLIVFLFNPFFSHFFISGRNDVFVMALLLLTFILLEKKYFLWSTFFFALAFSSKQTAWLLAPVYFPYLAWCLKNKKLFWQAAIIFIFTVALIFFPFLISNPQGFIDDVYRYPSGSLKTSFPIMGYGFSWLLVQLKALNWKDYFPFWIFQIGIGLPVLGWLINFLKKNLSEKNLIYSYGIFLFVFWFFSRFFNDNYLGFLFNLFVLAEFF